MDLSGDNLLKVLSSSGSFHLEKIMTASSADRVCILKSGIGLQVYPLSDLFSVISNPVKWDLLGISLRGVWSLCNRSSTYIGPLLRIRDTANNQEQDVGYGSNSLLASFNVTGSARITKLYDQSGGGNHLVQSSTAYQPLLEPFSNAKGGPRINFSGGAFLQGSLLGSDSSPIQSLDHHPILVSAFNRSSVATGQRGIFMIPHSLPTNSSPYNRACLWEDGASYVITPDGVNNVIGTNISAGQFERFIVDFGSQNTTVLNTYRNGVSNVASFTIDGYINYPALTTVIIGATANGAAPFNGIGYEFVIASGSLNEEIFYKLMNSMNKTWMA